MNRPPRRPVRPSPVHPSSRRSGGLLRSGIRPAARRRLAPLALPALVLLLLSACGRRDVGPGGVKVILALPKGTVESATSIDVSFDQAMVAVGATTATRPPLMIKPRVPGRFRWIGTRTASFVPDAPLPPATRFRVTVPAGTRAVDGKSLAGEFAWEFSTPVPAVVRSFPKEGADTITPDVQVLLEFNQPMAPAAVERAARLRADQPGGATVSLRASRPTKEQDKLLGSWPPPPAAEHRVVLVPAKPLPKNTPWVLALDGRLKGMRGPLPMEHPAAIRFRTCGPFRLERVRATDPAGRSITLVATNPVDGDSLAAHLSFDPPARVRHVWAWSPEEIHIQGSFEPGRSYRLAVTPGLTDRFGNALEPPPAPIEFTMGDLPPAVRIFPAGGVLERGRAPRAAVLLTNVERAFLEIKGIGRDDVLRLDGTEGSGWTGRNTGHGSLRRSWPLDGGKSRTLTRGTPRNVTDTVYVSTDEALGPGGAGIFAMRVTSLDPGPPADPDYKGSYRPLDTGFIRVTDLGLTAKMSPAGYLVWVTSLSTGEPVAGVELEVRSGFGVLLWRGVSDERGLAAGPREPTPARAGPLRLFARHGDDSTFLTLGQDWSLESWAFGFPGAGSAARLDIDGFVYGDRNLYRPGETVHLKAILRERIPAGLRVPPAVATPFQITDPRGRTVLDSLLDISRFGTLAVDFPLGRGARPGGYRVHVGPGRTGPETGWGVWGEFEVAEYRAPEFEARLVAGGPGYFSGQTLDARLSADYFFGAPLAGGGVSWTLGREPADYHPPGWAGYSFTDPDVSPDYEVLAGRGTATLGADGRLSLSPRLDLEGVPVSMRYHLEADVRDLTGQGAAAMTSVVVHRGQVYPGVRLGRWLVKAGQKIPVDAVTVSPEGKPAPGATARISLVRREWRTVRRLLVGGVIGAESSRIDTTLLSRSLPPGPGPHRLEFDVPTAGCYRVLVEASDGSGNRQRSAATFYASGPGEFGWGWEDGPRIELVTDRKEYAPGDTARVLVRSPFRAALALVTVEREGVREAWIRRLAGTSETIEIPIPTVGAAPNLYVSVALITGSDARAGADPRLAVPEFRLGMAALVIDHRDRVLSVAVAPARAEAAPGDSMRVSLRVTDRAGRGVPGEVSLAVVDEAVLRLLGTPTPDPVGHFYAPRPLSVTTSDLRRLVQRAPGGGEKGEEPGGDGAEGGVRSRFATTAAWLPAVRTDGSGLAEAAFRLPDNLTRFRIMAVAADAGDRFGSADTTFTVTRPLLVQPALPRFATAGDRFRAGAVVHNRTGRPLTVEVTAETRGLAPAALPRLTLAVPAHDSRRADFEVTAPGAGSATVRLAARAGRSSDAVEITLPVHRPAAWRSEATAGLAPGPVKERIELPAAALPESARVDLELSPTLLGGLGPVFDYLRGYPYGCLEQVGSKAWAALLEARLVRPERRREAVAGVAACLAPYQWEGGGFSLWPGHGQATVWATAYALLVLSEAGRAGAPVGEMSAAAVSFLDWEIREAGADTTRVLAAAPARALALWALSEAGIPERDGNGRAAALDLLTALRARLSATTRLHLALAWQGRPGGTASQHQILAELDNAAEQVADLAWLGDRCSDPWERGWYSPARVTGLYLAASVRSGRHSPLEPGMTRWLLEQRQNGRWGNTQASIMALLGLAAWRETYENAPPDLLVRAFLADRAAPEARFRALDQPPATVSWPAPAAGAGSELRLEREGNGVLYYSTRLHYLEPRIGRPPVETGLTLTRAWELFEPGRALSAPAAPLRPIRSGDLVLVRLTLVLPEEADFLVVADPLPAGLEPVQLGFLTTGRAAARALEAEAQYLPGHQALPVDYEEQRDREVRVFVDHAAPGVYEYRYLARAVTPGRFAAPAARAELMYHPEVMAQSDGPWVEVRGR